MIFEHGGSLSRFDVYVKFMQMVDNRKLPKKNPRTIERYIAELIDDKIVEKNKGTSKYQLTPIGMEIYQQIKNNESIIQKDEKVQEYRKILEINKIFLNFQGIEDIPFRILYNKIFYYYLKHIEKLSNSLNFRGLVTIYSYVVLYIVQNHIKLFINTHISLGNFISKHFRFCKNIENLKN